MFWKRRCACVDCVLVGNSSFHRLLTSHCSAITWDWMNSKKRISKTVLYGLSKLPFVPTDIASVSLFISGRAMISGEGVWRWGQPNRCVLSWAQGTARSCTYVVMGYRLAPCVFWPMRTCSGMAPPTGRRH